MLESMLMVLTFLFSYIVWKLTSNKQNKIKYHGKFFFYYFYVLLSSGLFFPVFLLKPDFTTTSWFFNCSAWFSRLLTYLCDLDFVLRNEQFLSGEHGAVIVSNHQYSLDIIGTVRCWKAAQKMTVVAKKELYYFWPFGLVARLAGIVFIDRSQPKAAYKSLKAAMHVMQDKKIKIWVFPEGKRNTKTNLFLPFKKGAFAMAVAAQVPIIPIVYSPYYFINKNKYIFTRGHVIMQCLEPVSTKGLTDKDVPALIDTIREKMLTTFKELKKEVLSGLPVDYPHPIDN